MQQNPPQNGTRSRLQFADPYFDHTRYGGRCRTFRLRDLLPVRTSRCIQHLAFAQHGSKLLVTK